MSMGFGSCEAIVPGGLVAGLGGVGERQSGLMLTLAGMEGNRLPCWTDIRRDGCAGSAGCRVRVRMLLYELRNFAELAGAYDAAGDDEMFLGLGRLAGRRSGELRRVLSS